MKILQIVLLILMVWSCQTKQSEPIQIQYISNEKAACEGNEENVFMYTHPKDAKGKLPLILVLDAQGRGELALNRLKEACVDFEMVIAASNTLRNGYPDYEKVINEVLKECVHRFPVDEKQIIVVGFSGGGRMAQTYSENYPVKGMIMTGAGPGTEIPGVKTYVIGGFRDFNFIEMYRRPVLGMIEEEMVCFDHFQGKHEWPPASNLRDGLLYLLSDQNAAITNYTQERVDQMLDKVDTLAMTHQGLRAWDDLDKSYKISKDAAQRKRIKANARDLMETEVFRLSISKLENHLRLELQLRQQYLHAIVDKDFSFWKSEIDLLREKSMVSSNVYEIDHAHRMLGYLGILYYSQLKVLIMTEGNNNIKDNVLRAFEYLEPDNADMFYYKAMHKTQLGQMDSASHYLALARQHGFRE